jgi:hypothetical protein
MQLLVETVYPLIHLGGLQQELVKTYLERFGMQAVVQAVVVETVLPTIALAVMAVVEHQVA